MLFTSLHLGQILGHSQLIEKNINLMKVALQLLSRITVVDHLSVIKKGHVRAVIFCIKPDQTQLHQLYRWQQRVHEVSALETGRA